jgi:cellulose synthase/poly-beta-1,6-N-acetylglucosamine synthase-like glycosyltransferase
MKSAFWLSVLVVAYTQFGYLAWLWLRSTMRALPIERDSCFPNVSVVMVVRNEEKVLPRKLDNLAVLDYPKELLDFTIVSDGSNDSTDEILRERSQSDPRFQPIFVGHSRGKAAGLNDGILGSKGEVILFTDARQEIEPDALRLLCQNFADSSVGCASGELMLGDRSRGESKKGTGLYWAIEKKVRQLESASGSVVGATGAIYAVRRNLLVTVPPGTILDDVYLPMHVVRQGARVVFDDRARAWDAPNLGDKREFSRKVRTLGGNYQLLQLAPWLLSRRNPIRFEFVSHKLLRLVLPLALGTSFISSLLLSGSLFRTALMAQVLFYVLSGIGTLHIFKSGLLGRAADAARTFVMLNLAAAVAFLNWAVGRNVEWVSSKPEMPLQAGEVR